MSRKIPQPLIGLLAEHISDYETHAKINSLFMYADAPGDAPDLSKHAKVLEWLRRTNKESEEPLLILGKIIENYMEISVPPYANPFLTSSEKQKPISERISDILSNYGLQYHIGGFISSESSPASLSLKEAIKKRNFPAIELEFNRAIENIVNEPREAVSAACNILESTFKIYISDEALPPPAKQDLQGLWKVVRESLGLDTKAVEDEDLKRILSGLYSLTDGIGALRTHASSAHGQGRNAYKLQPRHARLAINAAHTLTMFILESWDNRKNTM